MYVISNPITHFGAGLFVRWPRAPNQALLWKMCQCIDFEVIQMQIIRLEKKQFCILFHSFTVERLMCSKYK